MKVNLPPILAQMIAQLPPSARQLFTDRQGLTNAQTQAAIRSQFDAFGAQGQQLYQEFILAPHLALASAIQRLLTIAFAFGIVALLTVVFMPEVPLKKQEFFQQQP
jgi:hypothetical protein